MLKVLSMDLEKDQQHFMNERVGLPPDYIKELSVGALFAISKVDRALEKGDLSAADNHLDIMRLTIVGGAFNLIKSNLIRA